MERGTRKRDSQEVRRLLDSVKSWFSQPREIDIRVKQSGNGLNVAERRMLRSLAPSSRILDIGCAAGRASIFQIVDSFRSDNICYCSLRKAK